MESLSLLRHEHKVPEQKRSDEGAEDRREDEEEGEVTEETSPLGSIQNQ